MLKNFRKLNWPTVIILSIIEIYLLYFVVRPFLQQDLLQSWDMAGHLFASWFVKNMTFPNYTGWNPFFYAGYPQNTFYPPLYHYLTALISFLVGLPLALKLVNVGSVLVLPLSFYYFARKIKLSASESAVATLLMMLPIVTLPIHSGGTLYSSFFVGLGANALSLPILFFYLGKLADELDLRNLMVSSLLLSLIILSHFITGVMAVAMAAIFLLYRNKIESFLFTLAHFVITFLLCGFWLVPFFAYINYYGGTYLNISMGGFISLPILLVAMLGFSLALMEDDKRLTGAFLVAMVFSFLLYFVDFQDYKLPFHSYRFLIYPLIMVMIFPIKMLFNRQTNRTKTIVLAVFILAMLIYTGKILFPRDALEAARFYTCQPVNINYNQLNIGKVAGRVAIYNGDILPHVHDLRAFVTMASRCEALKGLFVESAINGPFILSLHYNTVRGGFVWGADTIPMEKAQYLTFNPNVLQKNLDLFNVNNLLVNYEIKGLPLEKRVKVEKKKPDYYLYKIGSSKKIELLKYPPAAVEADWVATIRNWFCWEDRKILVRAPLPFNSAASPNDRLTVLKQSPGGDYYKVQVEAKEAVPILFKVSYFPRWKAYVNGKEAPIFVASPYLMLVYGKGTVELKYGNSVFDFIGWGLSGFGLLLIVYLFVRYRSKSK